jgi:hypothetical protein
MRIGRREFTSAALVSASALIGSAAGQEKDKNGEKPQDIALRGRVVCVTEEFQRLYQTAADCERRGHVYALKTADGQLYPFLPTDAAAAIYTDERFRTRELQVTARLFPSVRIIEVIKLQSWQQGKLHNLFYFCEVCNLRTHKPGPCDCCQDPVQFREVLVTEDDEP